MNHAGMMQPSAVNPYDPDMMKMHERIWQRKVPTLARSREMIEHHCRAVTMSQTALRSTQNAETRREAQKTIDSQNREIATLNTMLQKMGKRPQ